MKQHLPLIDHALLRIAFAGLGSLLLLSACASPRPPPTAAIQAAEQAIDRAEQARVADHAPVELSEARDKLTAARSAVAEKEMVAAERFAVESRAEAELAAAKAEVAKARLVNDEMTKSMDSLRQEMRRNVEGQP